MRRHVDQCALVMLTVNFDERCAQHLERLCADRLIIDKGPGAAIGELHPAQDELVVCLDVVGGQDRAHGVAVRKLESGRHLTLLGAMTHQREIAARAERKREGIEQN